MIKIKPIVSEQFYLPGHFEERAVVEEIMFAGTHILAKCSYSSLRQYFYHTLPVGHTWQRPVVFSEDGQETYYHPEAKTWLAEPLIKSFLSRHTVAPITIRRDIRKAYRQVVILNCLDSCYGHCLYKLFNAQRHLRQRPELGLVLLIPRSLAWLVPEGTAEVWCVEAPVRQLKQYIPNLDGFVKSSFAAYDKVYLSRAITQLNTFKIDTESFTKVAPFELDDFFKTNPRITFVLREDRFWLTSRVDYFLYLASVKFNSLLWMKFYFGYRQNHLIRNAAQRIKEQLVDAQFFATGIGRTGKFGNSIKDCRVVGEVSSAKEKEWAQLYSSSHIVVGVHGSSMLIPTSLAAAFIILMPDYKIAHWGEDVVARHSTPNATFLGRFLPFSSARHIADHTIHLIKGFSRHCFKKDAPVSIATESQQNSSDQEGVQVR